MVISGSQMWKSVKYGKYESVKESGVKVERKAQKGKYESVKGSGVKVNRKAQMVQYIQASSLCNLHIHFMD
jgi:hypothetical protein